jgi:hypothetical protein
LHENNNIFSWLTKESHRVCQNLAQHSLNVAKGSKRAEAAKAKVQRLPYAEIVRFVQCPKWLGNVVAVICIDFRNLNKHCPKDLYPFSKNWRVSGHCNRTRDDESVGLLTWLSANLIGSEG